MPGRPGASGQERPGLKKYRFLIKFIKKSIDSERQGDREAVPESDQARKSIDFQLKSLRKVSILSAVAIGRRCPGAARLEKVSIFN